MTNISSIVCYQFPGFKQDTQKSIHRGLVCSSHWTFKNRLCFLLASAAKYYTQANSQFAFVSLLLITRGVEQTYYLMSGQDSRDNEKRACIGDKDTVTNPELLHTIITTCKWNDVIINISLYKSTIMRLLHC